MFCVELRSYNASFRSPLIIGTKNPGFSVLLNEIWAGYPYIIACLSLILALEGYKGIEVLPCERMKGLKLQNQRKMF